jgi:tyrosyl-tRNA synthetase
VLKLGLDPTRPDLHLGHAVVLKKLRAFQELGHKAVLIIGDATALIGDPSGRNHTRPPLTEAEVLANAQTYLDQAGKILAVDKAEIVRNSQFFEPLGMAGILKLMSQVTVAQILARDDFAKRYSQNTPIALHEFLYPLMQAYDSVMVKADVELGGTDQRFNNLLGREMQLAFAKLANNEQNATVNPQMVLLLPLLEGTDGKVKMSKSYPEHCINLTDDADTMFGKLMSIPDEMIVRYETLLTDLPLQQLQEHQAILANPEANGVNPRDYKVMMAKLVVSQFHSFTLADEAEVNFTNRFRHKALPTDMSSVALSANTPHELVSLLVEQGLAPSKTEARRLIQGGGVKLNLLNQAESDVIKVSDVALVLVYPPAVEVVLQVGKHKFLKLIFN